MKRILCATITAAGLAMLANCSSDNITAGQMNGDDGGAGRSSTGSAGSSTSSGPTGSATTGNAGGSPGSGGAAGTPGMGGDGNGGGPGAGGGAGKGGAAGKGNAGAAGAGGGAAGAGGKVGDGGLSCDEMKAQVEKLMAAAQSCNPMSSTVQCQQQVESICCPVFVNDANSQTTRDYLAALAPYKKMCPTPCPLIACGTKGVCMAGNAGGTEGTCTATFGM